MGYRTIIILVAVGLIAAACSGGATDEPVATTAVPTTVAPTTTAASEPAENPPVTATYDGSTCAYSGPNDLLEGPLEVTYVNDSDEDVGLHLAILPDTLTYVEYKTKVDAGEFVEQQEALWLNRAFEGFDHRGELTETAFVSAGEYTWTCVKFEGDGPPTGFIHGGLTPVGEIG